MNNHKIIGLSYPTQAQDAATRGYLKAFTRNNFLRRDGTNSMTGDLNNHKIIKVNGPSEDGEVANKRYVDSRKPVITIWAQEVGPLNAGMFEFSFGSGDYTQRQCGFCMFANGRILKGSFAVVGENGADAGNVIVSIIGNGGNRPAEQINNFFGSHSNTVTYDNPPVVLMNDRINIQTRTSNANVVNDSTTPTPRITNPRITTPRTITR